MDILQSFRYLFYAVNYRIKGGEIMKTAQILKTLATTVFMLVVMPGIALAAGQLKSVTLDLSDPRAGVTSSHTFVFTVSSGGNTEQIEFLYCKTPSGNCETPALTTDSVDLDEVASDGITDFGWTLTAASVGTNEFVLQESDDGETLSADEVVTIDFDSITNSAITACDVATDTDTCYVRIQTCSDLGCDQGEVLDVATVSYTTVAAVTVSARVDPTFTFVIAGVNSGTGTVGDATTSVTSTYSTLPFSNLTAGTEKYAAHKLTVTTNTDSGYIVNMQMQQQMTGVYGGDIDPFAGTGAAWSNPIAWTEPTGSTANTNTGWIGANTNDTDVPNWSSNVDGSDNALFGPVNGTENMVMKSTTSDNGANSVYVTYAIEANVYQPADTYGGRLVYNAFPTY